MRCLPHLLPLIALTACSFTPGAASDGGMKDARLDDADPLLVDAPPADGAHLLLTEVQSEGAFEFIEIFNPTGAPVNLSTYYLSDYNQYWKLSRQVVLANEIPADMNDFLVKFPDGATLGSNEVATIAFDGPEVEGAYGVVPTYTIAVAVASAAAMTIMIDSADPGITNEGEMIVLFQWDGQSDLVKDVDIVVTGKDPIPANALIAKQAIDGKDVDMVATSYAGDALSMDDMTADATGSNSYKRIKRETGRETHGTSGNGITLHDETSEDIRMTWDIGVSLGTPGVVSLSD